MTLQELQCFLVVAKTKSYSKAAQELFVSQPAISKHISALEQELNTTLVDRTVRRNIHLTQTGELLYESLYRCQADFSKTMAAIRDMSASAPIIVNVSDDCTLPEWLFQIFDNFNDLLGDVPLDINFISYDHFSAALSRGEFILTIKEALVSGKNLKSRQIHREAANYFIILSALHPVFNNSETDISPSDLAGIPLFLPKSMPPELIERYVNYAEHFVGVRPSLLLLDSMDTVSLYLKGNRGMTLATSWYKHFHNPQLRAVPLNISTHYYLQWNPQKNINPKISLFLDMI